MANYAGLRAGASASSVEFRTYPHRMTAINGLRAPSKRRGMSPMRSQSPGSQSEPLVITSQQQPILAPRYMLIIYGLRITHDMHVAVDSDVSS